MFEAVWTDEFAFLSQPGQADIQKRRPPRDQPGRARREGSRANGDAQGGGHGQWLRSNWSFHLARSTEWQYGHGEALDCRIPFPRRPLRSPTPNRDFMI